MRSCTASAVCPPWAVLQPTACAAFMSGVAAGPDPRLVSIVDDEHADGRRQKLDSDRAACTTGPDKECPCPFHVSSMVCLRLHEGEAVQHVAVPGAVRIA